MELAKKIYFGFLIVTIIVTTILIIKEYIKFKKEGK